MDKSARSGLGFGVCILVAALGAGSAGCAETTRQPAMTQVFVAPDEIASDGRIEAKKASAKTTKPKAQGAGSSDEEQTWWRREWRR